MEEHMLTTIDNPFDPFTQFDEWFAFDTSKGYNSCGYLARITNTSLNLSDADYDLEVERALDEIVRLDPTNLYIKISKNSERFNKK